MLGAAGEGVAVSEHQVPAVLGDRVDELVNVLARAGMKGEVVQPRAAAFVLTAGHCWGLLEHYIRWSEPIADAALPGLIRLVTELSEQPPPAWTSGGQVRNPDLDVMQQATLRAMRGHARHCRSRITP